MWRLHHMRNNSFNGSPILKNGVPKSSKESFTEGVVFTTRNYSAVVLLCLQDKFDFTTEQLQEVSVYLNDTFDSVLKGYLTLEDIAKTLKLESNIDLTFGKSNE